MSKQSSQEDRAQSKKDLEGGKGGLLYGQVGPSIPSLHRGLSRSNICELDTIETEKMGRALLFRSDVRFGMARTTSRKEGSGPGSAWSVLYWEQSVSYKVIWV